MIGTPTRTTSRAPAPSGCRRSCSTATAPASTSPAGYRTCSPSRRLSVLPSDRLLLGFVALVLGLAACQSGSDERTLFVLLTDNRLLRISEQGDVLTSVRLGPAPEFALVRLAGWPRARTSVEVYALVRGKQQRVVSFERGGAVADRYALPGDVTWRRLAVGPQTGRLYLAGDVAGSRRNDLGEVELGVRLLVLSPDGERISLTPIRKPAARDSYTGWLTVAPDESSLLVSYHGSQHDRIRPRPAGPGPPLALDRHARRSRRVSRTQPRPFGMGWQSDPGRHGRSVAGSSGTVRASRSWSRKPISATFT